MALSDAQFMVYRYDCACGRCWWANERGSLMCRRCRRLVQSPEGKRVAPTPVATVHVHTTPSSKGPDELRETVPKVGIMMRWFAVMVVVSLANQILNSDAVSHILGLALMAWTWAMISVVLIVGVSRPRECGWLERIGELIEWELIPDLLDNDRHKDSKFTIESDCITQRYFDGGYDADEFDTRVGAVVGVKKDQERLRLLKELEK